MTGRIPATLEHRGRVERGLDGLRPYVVGKPATFDENPAFHRGVDEFVPPPDVNTKQVTATRSRPDTAVGRIR